MIGLEPLFSLGVLWTRVAKRKQNVFKSPRFQETFCSSSLIAGGIACYWMRRFGFKWFVTAVNALWSIEVNPNCSKSVNRDWIVAHAHSTPIDPHATFLRL